MITKKKIARIKNQKANYRLKTMYDSVIKGYNYNWYIGYIFPCKFCGHMESNPMCSECGSSLNVNKAGFL